jgi:hypothetical protein
VPLLVQGRLIEKITGTMDCFQEPKKERGRWTTEKERGRWTAFVKNRKRAGTMDCFREQKKSGDDGLLA